MTTDLPPFGIQRLLEICDEATEGPWRAPGRKNGVVTSDDCQICKCGDFQDREMVPFNADRWNADRDLIVAARTALPDALRALTKVTEERNGFQRERAALFDKLHGTPCEQVRHQQESEASRERIAALEAALGNIVSCEHDVFDPPSNGVLLMVELARAVLSGGKGE